VSGFTAEQILLVSGAFHYWEGSVREFVRQFPERPDHIIINRTPVHESHEFFTVQHWGSYGVPCVVRNAKELTSAFAAEDYVMIDRWCAFERSLRMLLLPNYTVPYYSGFYFCHQGKE
jgi:putative methyltransferase (TIGR04325 family)